MGMTSSPISDCFHLSKAISGGYARRRRIINVARLDPWPEPPARSGTDFRVPRVGAWWAESGPHSQQHHSIEGNGQSHKDKIIDQRADCKLCRTRGPTNRLGHDIRCESVLK